MAARDRVHVLAIPYPAQGHINPMLELCKYLIPRGFSITFVNTEHNHARIFQSRPSELLDDYLKRQEIQFVPIPGGSPPELHGNRAKRGEAFRASFQLEGPFEQLLSTLMQEGPPVAFILSDVLLGWTQRISTKFGLPRVALWAASAATFSAFFHISQLIAAQGVSSLFPGKHGDSVGEILIPDIPGLPPTSPDDLPLVSNMKDGEVTEVTKLVADQFLLLLQASCVLANSFHALEGRVLDAISSRIAVEAIGPLLPSEYLSGDVRLEKVIRPNLFPEDGTCLAWLNKQNPGSVLYISFGSISVRSTDQLLELAMGLEASEYPFLWAIRSIPVDAGGSSSVFNAFMERTRGKGLVVPWVPQLEVLSHGAVGGFMTHCGWNSVMESVAMGVTMLCWADTGERRSNQKFVVNEWGVGMAMAPGGVADVDKVIQREEVERTVRAFMKENGITSRARAAELKRSASLAAMHDSSERLQQFVATMKETAAAGSSDATSS